LFYFLVLFHNFRAFATRAPSDLPSTLARVTESIKFRKDRLEHLKEVLKAQNAKIKEIQKQKPKSNTAATYVIWL
jgi:hypothetical protein